MDTIRRTARWFSKGTKASSSISSMLFQSDFMLQKTKIKSRLFASKQILSFKPSMEEKDQSFEKVIAIIA